MLAEVEQRLRSGVSAFQVAEHVSAQVQRNDQFGAEPEVRADVFVSSVQTCKEPRRYDALDISQWEFYVVSAERVRECAYKSVSIAWVREHAAPVPFSDPAASIERVRRGTAAASA